MQSLIWKITAFGKSQFTTFLTRLRCLLKQIVLSTT